MPGAESLEMLEVTVHALITMAYPHDTWVLDEGDDARVQALCTRLGARHFSRKALPHYQTAQGPFKPAPSTATTTPGWRNTALRTMTSS